MAGFGSMNLGLASGRGPISASGGGGPEWLPSGAVFHIDFANGNYYAGEAVRQLADVIDGNPFDPNSIDANGLLINDTTPNYPFAIGELYNDISAMQSSGTTIIVEMYLPNPDVDFYDIPPISLSSDAYNAMIDAHVLFDTVYASQAITDTDVLSVVQDPAISYSYNVIHGFTLYRAIGGGSYESATCVNGGTIATQAVSYPLGDVFSTYPLNLVEIGNRQSSMTVGDFRVKRVTGYQPMSSAAMQALTVV